MRPQRPILVTLLFLGLPLGLLAGDILVIGSTRSYLDGAAAPVGDAWRQLLSEELKLSGEENIVFEDIYRAKTLDTAIGGKGKMVPMEYRCHSLAQWYFWPEGREQRLANLRGEAGTKWARVVLIGDPYIQENMPGVYAEGVNLVSDEIRQGSATPVLLSAGRVGQDAGANPFAMKYVTARSVTYSHTGTSSERGISGALEAAIRRCGATVRRTSPKEGQPKIDFNYGRANSAFEKHKQYEVAPEQFGRSYGFPMQDHAKTAATTMLYGIDKRFVKGQYEDGTDLGIAHDMIQQGEVAADIRCVPIRLMWAKMQQVDPDLTPFRDKWHMSRELDEASGAFIYTLLSGRCPVGAEPPRENQKSWRAWLGRRIGYETAWRMAHLRARVPGFSVLPASDSEPLRVHFLYPPSSDVTCRISIEPADAATAEPAALIFTANNHATAQAVTVTPSSANSQFRIIVRTESTDAIYSGLSDTWSYRVAN